MVKHRIQDNAPRILLTIGGVIVVLFAVGVVLCRNAWGGF